MPQYLSLMLIQVHWKLGREDWLSHSDFSVLHLVIFFSIQVANDYKYNNEIREGNKDIWIYGFLLKITSHNHHQSLLFCVMKSQQDHMFSVSKWTLNWPQIPSAIC